MVRRVLNLYSSFIDDDDDDKVDEANVYNWVCSRKYEALFGEDNYYDGYRNPGNYQTENFSIEDRGAVGRVLYNLLTDEKAKNIEFAGTLAWPPSKKWSPSNWSNSRDRFLSLKLNVIAILR